MLQHGYTANFAIAQALLLSSLCTATLSPATTGNCRMMSRLVSLLQYGHAAHFEHELHAEHAHDKHDDSHEESHDASGEEGGDDSPAESDEQDSKNEDK